MFSNEMLKVTGKEYQKRKEKEKEENKLFNYKYI